MKDINTLLNSVASQSQLAAAVVEDIKDAGDTEDIANYVKDVTYGGGASGVIGSLVYYTDTVPFYEKHENDILELAIEQAEEMGYDNLGEFIATLNFDKSDVQLFKSGMAWFAYEEITRKIADELEAENA